ncbi:hypothetical protein CRG98_019901 [Punica granatum]|uniref:Uncharacterized protein n=1 Tax=Punica granatum TaxID=22663 RepID=A0A2I0JTU8_PUNGR|nr:hypothetical protein CRG98_019901 [Punica granatum]
MEKAIEALQVGESRLDSGDGNGDLFPGIRLPPKINAVNLRCPVAQQYSVNTLTPPTAWACAPPLMQYQQQYQAGSFYYSASLAYPSPRIPRPFVHNYVPAILEHSQIGPLLQELCYQLNRPYPRDLNKWGKPGRKLSTRLC